jgi:ABC-type polysaccharide/polyol phosphate export permease
MVESLNTVLFWLVPIFYSFSIIPPRYTEVYALNPVAAIILILRTILLEGQPPLFATLLKFAASSFLMLALGFLVFRRLKRKFYDYV